jgi:hypothetical protein
MTYLDELAREIRARLAEGVAPSDSESLFLIYAVLARAKGEQVTPEDVHDAWVAWMAIRGEEHESMVPFDELPSDVRSEDLPFVDAIKAIARRRPSS